MNECIYELMNKQINEFMNIGLYTYILNDIMNYMNEDHPCIMK